jgi:hypothetical protein
VTPAAPPAADPGAWPVAGPFAPTFRAVPSRYPPIQAFADVAEPDDLAALMELEGWTNDRLVRHRLRRLPEDQWVMGRANASVVMAAFLHASPEGARFNDADLGAWYAGLAETTAIKEVAHHLRREVVRSRRPDITSHYRLYQASLAGDYVDIRGGQGSAPDLYRPDDHQSGQAFGARVRASTRTGIVYDSLRDPHGTNVVCFRPRAVENVTQTRHVELTVPAAGKIVVRQL